VVLYTVNRQHVLWSAVNEILEAPQRVKRRIADIIVAGSSGSTVTAAIYEPTDHADRQAMTDMSLMLVFPDDFPPDRRDQLLRDLRQNLETFTGNKVRIFDMTGSGLAEVVRVQKPIVQALAHSVTVAGPNLYQLIAASGRRGARTDQIIAAYPASTTESEEAGEEACGAAVGVGIDVEADGEDIDTVVEALCEGLGAELVAYLGRVDDLGIVERWAGGSVLPTADGIAQLRLALQVLTLLEREAPIAKIRDWFTTPSRGLGGESPAHLIREREPRQIERIVTEAARRFLRLS